MKRLAIVFSGVLLLGGCMQNAVISSNPNSETNLGVKNGFESFGLTGVDFGYAANQAVEQFLEDPNSNKPGGGSYVVALEDVSNDTTFDVDTRDLTSQMKRKMRMSGRFIFTAAVGADRQGMIGQARELSRSKLIDQRTVAKNNTVIAPELFMYGSIRQNTNVSGDASKQRLDYSFDLSVVDIDTGLIIFESYVPIDKTGSNKNFAW